MAQTNVGNHFLLPPWVLAPQLFLASGWLRAAISHGIDRRWWQGQELLEFASAQAETSIIGYSTVFDHLVKPFPVGVSLFVLVAELFVGMSLFFNWRPLAGLALGAFLNLHFILAGVVNPSVFYLVLGAGVASWRLDRLLTPIGSEKLASTTTWLALLATALLIPAVSTVNPDDVVEDPALVLVLLVILAVITTRSMAARAVPERGLRPPTGATGHRAPASQDVARSPGQPEELVNSGSEVPMNEVLSNEVPTNEVPA